jgi:RNA polymerase sigma factor (sigma-70 family)
MHAPLRLGLSPSDAQPGEPGGTHAPRSDDRALLDAVRGGDTDAFGVLYSRHLAAVRRLSRRVARDRDEADDIVSDVFANTLRAIRRGRGPVDDAQAYLLRSVRHTAGKLRSRKDTGRSEPVPIDRLDRPVSTDVHLRSDIEIALLHLPDRHRDVLWATCVEGRPAGELAAADGVAASCVTSLTLRARRALGRSYLLQRTARPEPTTKCRRIRTSMPGCLRDEVTATTATTIYDHIDGCGACREVYEEIGLGVSVIGSTDTNCDDDDNDSDNDDDNDNDSDSDNDDDDSDDGSDGGGDADSGARNGDDEVAGDQGPEGFASGGNDDGSGSLPLAGGSIALTLLLATALSLTGYGLRRSAVRA